jgi:hypothetical protein
MATTVATPMDFWRLAEEGERRGIRVLVEPISGEHFATSGSDPTKLYRLTHYSCSCKGFQVWQRCTHYALFLAQLGWLPDPDPEPEVPSAAVPSRRPVQCSECRGLGTSMVQASSGARFEARCVRCGGTGEVAAIPVEIGGDESRRDASGDTRSAPRPIASGPDPWDEADDSAPTPSAGFSGLHALYGEPLDDGRLNHSRKLAA